MTKSKIDLEKIRNIFSELESQISKKREEIKILENEIAEIRAIILGKPKKIKTNSSTENLFLDILKALESGLGKNFLKVEKFLKENNLSKTTYATICRRMRKMASDGYIKIIDRIAANSELYALTEKGKAKLVELKKSSKPGTVDAVIAAAIATATAPTTDSSDEFIKVNENEDEQELDVEDQDDEEVEEGEEGEYKPAPGDFF